ncbi:MAG TPA: Smr/MutS family protein [Pyrinomonadaceae bacterium]|nr:Smr/MutS family protein [Pyrinomonadaceae bacterium]
MQPQSFTVLEFDQLRALVRRGAQTPMGQAQTDLVSPIEDLEELQRSLAAVGELVLVKRRGVNWSFTGMIDPAPAIVRLRMEGASLDAPDLLEIARLCGQALEARASIMAERELAPVLWRIVADLPRDLHSVLARITNKILPGGELDDRASPELARIRHEIARLRSNIERSLEKLMRASEGAIQDELVTLRNDRYVIPVRADHRGRVQGVAHGFSSSGATVFIEPLTTIEANNELQGLRESEQQEIGRILLDLTAQLRSQLPAIETAVQVVTELDLINAKAIFHEKFNCVIPQIGSGMLELIEARHPLLEENLRGTSVSVVPVSFSLDDDEDTIVISGANAGGKTVVLKTSGLLSLMALSGLPVPARRATVPFYSLVLADIGDHQSLAANLSTFTSHLANISEMLKMCRRPALVLLDEVGTGTDPEEGSALGVAVVDHFRKVCGAHVMATTHYSGLKMYAASEEGVVNASVEFDEKTLRPTYRLIIGIAGASSGLEIARRFGIDDEIVAAAASRVSASARQAMEYLQRVKREADEVTALRQALEEERAAVAEKFSKLDRRANEREQQRQKEFEHLLQKSVATFENRAKELVAGIQDRAERLKVEREVQKRAAELKREAARAVSASRGGVPEARPARGIRVLRNGQAVGKTAQAENRSAMRELPAAENYVTAEPRDIVVGDRVRLRTLGLVGIVEQIRGDEAEVRAKSLHFREKLAQLELVEAIESAKREGRFVSAESRARTKMQLNVAEENVPSELNVIGRTTDEAVDAVDKFLDQATLANLGEVRIVHGHGTGALRRAIGGLLKDHPHVERFSPAPPERGGAGATIVQLQQ